MSTEGLKLDVHLSIEHLHGPEEVPYREDELVVVCLVRDGRPYVRSFVEHYLSLGAKHIFFLDNGSTDGTVETLKNYDNTTVLRSKLPFKEYKFLMRQYLIDRFGKKDRWCLYADIDELFDYPYSDVVGLNSFLGYLSSNSYTAVAAQMLDMFPEEPLSGREGSPVDEPLKERHRFYDTSNINRTSVKELNYLDDLNNTLQSDEIEIFRDGIQNTIFGSRLYLTKHPLVFTDGRIKLSDRSSHWVANAKIADITCVLFHYKFLDGYFHKQAAQAVRERQYHNNSTRYKRYLEALDTNWSLRVKRESARELKGVNDLVENGFLVVSEQYIMMVYEEEEKHKSAEHTPLRSERGSGPEDEAALYRARAQAKAQSLRAQRLKRHLKELREQNQREVERLSTRLARFRKKNRNLTQQLQSIRASRSVRLLNKLARIRAGMLGRKH
jgi:glycosyltransferase involved in cell wall biosynthesis